MIDLILIFDMLLTLYLCVHKYKLSHFQFETRVYLRLA